MCRPPTSIALPHRLLLVLERRARQIEVHLVGTVFAPAFNESELDAGVVIRQQRDAVACACRTFPNQDAGPETPRVGG